ncbi:pullulanase [Paenibacillus selenitireducens]|uniref:Pullulanase n=1 Tax=Paenibacillus selenitireducens TaxID=1324314 RepID=A0A1T2X5Z4_9BACL|nr:DUF6509 family protein [Paenibacillus selenitireducens]OPA75309.1 pullulanase [Paenibacillus selenitireducens]
MINITSYTVERVKDPFGILSGTRYEFLLDIEVEEDDELYSENGLYIRVIFSVEETQSRIAKYEIYEKSTQRYVDFDLEDDEVAVVEAFCQAHFTDSDET